MQNWILHNAASIQLHCKDKYKVLMNSEMEKTDIFVTKHYNISHTEKVLKMKKLSWMERNMIHKDINCSGT